MDEPTPPPPTPPLPPPGDQPKPNVAPAGSDSYCCNCKALAKFILIYCVTFLVILLIFTALNSEQMTDEEAGWWWAFLISLLFTTSVSICALISLIYTDYYRIEEDQDGDQSKGILKPMMEDSRNTSFKTILTINSTAPQSS